MLHTLQLGLFKQDCPITAANKQRTLTTLRHQWVRILTCPHRNETAPPFGMTTKSHTVRRKRTMILWVSRIILMDSRRTGIPEQTPPDKKVRAQTLASRRQQMMH